jgi:hypothetical protein
VEIYRRRRARLTRATDHTRYRIKRLRLTQTTRHGNRPVPGAQAHARGTWPPGTKAAGKIPPSRCYDSTPSAKIWLSESSANRPRST